MRLKNELIQSLLKLEELSDERLEVMEWAVPVVAFGNVENSFFATLGINPSDREFINSKGKEIAGNERRFPTLNSLGIDSWSKINQKQIELILDMSESYFLNNPYDRWFKKLDFLIAGAGASYYFPSLSACHLDLIPYATREKWGNISKEKKETLLSESSDILGSIINKSSIKVLLLNGRSVIENFKRIAEVDFSIEEKNEWLLPRKNGKGVKGYSYEGITKVIGNERLNNEVHVLGFNHNIQSSFGVTKEVELKIREWVSKKVAEYGTYCNP